MAQIANLSLGNGRATPVVTVFTPVMAALNLARWSDKTSGRFIGLPTITIESKTPAPGGQVFVVKGNIRVPTLETITNANSAGYTAPPQEAYFHLVKFEILCPVRGSVVEREDTAAYTANLFKDPQFLALMRGFEMPY